MTTKDTVFVGFGAEGLTTQAMRNDLIRRSMTHLLGMHRRNWLSGRIREWFGSGLTAAAL